MLRKTTAAARCLASLWAVTPVLAAPGGMPQGQRDRMSLKATEHATAMRRKENGPARADVDRVIENRR